MLGGDIGIRLKALEYWRCAEVGLIAPSPSSSSLIDDASLKLVLVEAVPGVGKLSSTINQISDVFIVIVQRPVLYAKHKIIFSTVHSSHPYYNCRQ